MSPQGGLLGALKWGCRSPSHGRQNLRNTDDVARRAGSYSGLASVERVRLRSEFTDEVLLQQHPSGRAVIAAIALGAHALGCFLAAPRSDDGARRRVLRHV